jgi:N-acetyl-anhydromuramyl-L-alanine amidase AmpD
MKTTQIEFRGYYREEHPKKQIFLHHTAGGPDAKSVFKYWEQTPERVATCVAISRSGEIVQGFASKFWGFHLGLKNEHFRKHGVAYQPLDKSSIGIEICAFGPLTKKGTKFINYVGGEIDADDVCELDKPWKGTKYWHKYTDEQIESVKQLLLHWRDKYGISLEYNDDIWDVTKRALRGENGVFTHNSVRPDKADVFPQPELVEMLKSL